MDVVYGIVGLFLLFHGFTIAQNVQNIHEIIANKEKQVKAIAAEIVRLDAHRCDIAASCSSSCSRDACNPTEEFDDPNLNNFTCPPMKENKICSANSKFPGDCNARKVNYGMSSIMMASTATMDEMCSTICMARNFTSTLKPMANDDQYNDTFYFGSVEGVIFMFPGEYFEKIFSACQAMSMKILKGIYKEISGVRACFLVVHVSSILPYFTRRKFLYLRSI